MSHINLTWKPDYKQAILLPFLVFIICVEIILFWLPARQYTQLYRLQAENYTQNIIRQTNLGISQSLFQFEEKINRIIDDPSIRAFLASDDPVENYQYEYQNIIENYFSFQSLDAYYLEGLDLYPVNQTDGLHYGYKSTSVKSVRDSSYYTASLIYPTTLNWLPYNIEEQCLEVVRCIYDYESFETKAILIIRLSHDFLLDKFENMNILDADSLYILNSNGQILCSDDSNLPGTVYDNFPCITNTSGTFSINNRIYSYARLDNIFSTVPSDTWFTVFCLDETSMFSSFRRILLSFNILAVLILVASIIIIIIFSRYLTAPIYALTEALHEVSQENFAVSLPDTSFLKEYTIINRGFNQMIQKLDNLINTVYKTQLAQKEAQLKNLQSQMNPHFLFNTLQLISWKAYEYEAYPVCDMISSLSYMLQTDLHSDDEKTFTLRQELDYIKQYSYIIHCKYNSMISINTDVPESLLDCRIPKLILQPFLENSIRHGLEPKTGRGTVTLTIRQESSDLICIIEDDGIGISQETLEQIRKTDSMDKHIPVEKGHQIALSNIQQRIRLLYGEPYGFTVTSQMFHGTRVILRIPYRPHSQEDTDSYTSDLSSREALSSETL